MEDKSVMEAVWYGRGITDGNNLSFSEEDLYDEAEKMMGDREITLEMYNAWVEGVKATRGYDYGLLGLL